MMRVVSMTGEFSKVLRVKVRAALMVYSVGQYVMSSGHSQVFCLHG
jgi:hypothetical protein